MPNVPFEKIHWKRWRTSYSFGSSEPLWVGWDTETCQGNIGMIAGVPTELTSQSRQHILNLHEDDYAKRLHTDWIPFETYSEYTAPDTVDTKKIIDLLFHPGFHGAWYNLGYDIECIIKHFPIDVVRLLLEGIKVNHLGYEIHYIPKKKFSLKKGNASCHHFDMSQFYHLSLENAASRFLNESKKDDDLDTSKMGESWGYWKGKESLIEEYCIYDSKLTKDLAELWYRYSADFDIDSSYPISPANVAGKHALKQGWPNYPKHLHNHVGKVAYASYYGGRFEARIKGYLPEAYLSDIRSAYPSEMVHLPSSSAGWERTSIERKAIEGLWGFVEAEIKISDEADWSPIMERKPDGLVYSPVGYIGKKWITLDEYKACKQDPDTKVDMVKAWIGKDDGSRPMEWVGELYEKRAKLKRLGDPREFVLKIMMNSVYGKTIQMNEITELSRVDEYSEKQIGKGQVVLIEGEPYSVISDEYEIGPLFNPMYASTITARTRCKLWEFMQSYDTAIVMTDGLLTTEKPSASEFGSELGDWERDDSGSAVIIGNGLYQIEGKKPKTRGFGTVSRNFDWFQILNDCDPDTETITFDYRRPLHPGEVMVTNKYNLTDVGAFREMPKSVNLNHDRKRSFPRVNAKKLLDDNYEGKCLKFGEY